MVVTIKKGMSKEHVKSLIDKALISDWKKKRQKKILSLKKLGGLLSHLKMTPLEIQKELRDGWIE